MSTINIDLAADTILNVMIGQQDENEVREVVFDYSGWYTTYGSGTISLAIQRAKDEWPYEGELTVDSTNHKATWEISDTDTAYAGTGQIQLSYKVGDAKKKSVVYRFTCHKSLGALGSVVTPVQIQTFIDEVEEALQTMDGRLDDMDDQIDDVKADLAEFKYGGGGLTDEARYALLACFEQIAWIGNDGQDYYDALASALFPVAELTSISAVYTQSGYVYTTDSLDSLKSDLVVTAYYDDSSSQTITTYILSGTLEAGTSTITVSFGGKTTTFDVIVKGVPSTYQMYDYITSAMNASANFAQTDLIKLKTYADLNTLSCEFWYRAESSHTTGSCIWGRRNGSGYTNSYAFYANNGYLGYHLHGVDGGTSAIQSANGALHHVTYNNPSASPSTVYSDDKSKSVVWSNSNVLNLAPTILTNAPDDSSASGVGIGIKCGRIRFYDYDGTRISDYIPCVRTADSVLGMYDIIDGVFYTASDSASCTVGGANVKYSIGNWS